MEGEGATANKDGEEDDATANRNGEQGGDVEGEGGRGREGAANEVNLDDDDLIYTPQVSDELRPKKGQEFNTIDDVVTFYNAYAKAAGFSIRSWTTQKEPGSGEIRRKEYVCFKQGKSLRIADVGKKRRQGSLAEDCPAKIAVLKSNSKKYIVTVFNEEHSHPLSTRSHRNVSAATKSLTKQLSMVNIPQHQQFSFLGVYSGGIENIRCTQKDLYNHGRDIRADMKGHDGEMFYEYLKLKQEKNPSFTFQIEADEEQKITRCFWSNASSRRAYNFFGDVVIFDTTYNTNRYGFIFAPIMGVNNHGQTIIFACGFLNHESVDDFVWLFNQFLESMPGGAPKMIITDQDPAMTKAFPLVLPNTFHRYCSWHILMKFSEKIDAVKYSIYKSEFSACIWKSETPEEFDLQWESLIKKSGLEGNRCCKTNMNFGQDGFLHMLITFSQQTCQFGRGLVRQRHEELMADHKDLIEKPKLGINHDFLEQMVDIYTNEMYFKFEAEVCDNFNYKLQFVRETDNRRVYQIQRKKLETSKVREIVYDKDLDLVSCSCKKFESAGIVCTHIISYLMKFDAKILPDKYILKRWTKSAKSGTVVDDKGMQINPDNSYLLTRSQFIQSSLELVDKSLVCEETRKMFTDGVRIINEQIDQFISSRTIAKIFTEKKIK
ncbi:protein FAR1-RELATED SEQUENCE 5-like [Asparagus officinalis]|uniref:protein FAR1-RELATED SEQUENCE 5-like n=1 Tax=Asparagus officinalis TaxID=4686 RepID=UPI00098E4BA2|nr:protein FAR1-RELATED SEQUENCE 5-like [Asparagus officinalis]